MKPKLKLDGANGVGADRVKSLMSHIGDIVDIQVYNDGTTGKLNYMVSTIIDAFMKICTCVYIQACS